MLTSTCHSCGFDAGPTPAECCGMTFCGLCRSQHVCQSQAPSAAGGMTLRPYQEEAVASVLRELEANPSTLLVLPTGCGKTIVFAETIRRWKAGRVLVMAHRDELIQQACKKIEIVTGAPCDVEMADAYADCKTFFDRTKVVVTSVQTMSRPRRHGRFNPDDFGLVIVDEAHHAVGRTYKAVIEHFKQARVLGVTATPDRADEAALGQVFTSVAYEYQLPQAIDDGWLVPIQQQFVTVESLDLSEVGRVAGDLNQGQLAAVMEAEKNLHGVVGPTIDLARGEQTLVFATSVDQAERMAEIANRHRAGSAEWICGDQVRTPRDVRRDTLRRFSERKFQFLFNCGVLLEGFDEPSIGVVAVARPTKSRSLYAQMIGRGTRTLPGTIDGVPEAVDRRAAIAASRKPTVLVLDFVGNSGQHKLVHTADVLGGSFDDEIVAAATRAVRAASTRGERQDMLFALREAEHELKAAEQRKRSRMVAKAKYQTKIVNPFDVWDVMPKREPGWHKGRIATEGQRACLAKFGLPEDEIRKLSFCCASQLIDEAIKRRKSDLCSFKQAKVLKRFGLSSEVTFKEASQLIDRIAANGWKPISPTAEAAA